MVYILLCSSCYAGSIDRFITNGNKINEFNFYNVETNTLKREWATSSTKVNFTDDLSVDCISGIGLVRVKTINPDNRIIGKIYGIGFAYKFYRRFLFKVGWVRFDTGNLKKYNNDISFVEDTFMLNFNVLF